MGVQNRTVYTYKDARGVLKFNEWATVTHSDVGTCAEPFIPNQHAQVSVETSVPAFDYDDDCRRIDKIVEIERGKRNMVLSNISEGIALHGGEQSLA